MNEALQPGAAMRRIGRTLLLIAALAATLMDLQGARAGDAWPTRPVTIVVPYPAGGVVDVRVRELTAGLEKELGQQVIVDNRPGAMGTIGGDRVAKAKPDGYTILAGTISDQAIVPAFGIKAPFDVERDLMPITPYVHGNSILVVPTSLGVKSVAELAALIRQKPGVLNYGTAGKGTFAHFLGRLFLRATGGDAVDVAYKGGSVMLPDLVSGRLQFQFEFVPTSMAFIESGRLRALMTTASKRVPVLPDVPTAREVGLADLEIMTWGGFFAPAGTPRPVIDRLSAAISKSLESAEIRQRWEAAGAEPTWSSPEEFTAFRKAERAKWERIANATGIRAE